MTENENEPKWEPKILEQRKEKGYTFTRYAPAYAEGWQAKQITKPKSGENYEQMV